MVGCSKSRLVSVMKLTVLSFPCACTWLTCACSTMYYRGWRDSKCTVDSIGGAGLSYLEFYLSLKNGQSLTLQWD